MTSAFKFDMIEVLRLTREGRVHEATALLRGEAPETRPVPPAPAGTPAVTHEPAIDLVAPRGPADAWSFPGFATPGTSGEPAGLKSLHDLVNWWEGRPGKPAETPAAPGPRVPGSGATFEERTFSGPYGQIAYKLFVPASYTGAPLPLVVMLHGCSQSPDDFAAGTRMNEVAEAQTALVVYPAQSKSANPSKCWNWFESGHQGRDQGEPALIAGITRQIMQEFPVIADQVFIAGLSAGGAAAAIMGETYPDLYRAVGVHSGLACGAASDMSSAFGAMRNGAPARCESAVPGGTGTVPTIVFHGDQDTTVNPVNGDHVIDRVKGNAPVQTTVDEGQAPSGMRFTRTAAVDGKGRPVLEQWVLHGAGHAWSGGSSAGTYTDPRGPDASREMMRFFLRSAGA